MPGGARAASSRLDPIRITTSAMMITRIARQVYGSVKVARTDANSRVTMPGASRGHEPFHALASC